ncbi:amidohydrolase family protein [candidate division KSB1 bacterium]
MKKYSILFIAIFLLSICAGNVFAQKYAITNATIVTVTNGTIENGTLIMEDGKITRIGRNISAPSDAMVVDGRGKFVYPGMIGCYTGIGLNITSGIWQTTDQTETGEFNTYFRASQAVNPASKMINIHRYTGITNAIATPMTADGIIGGQEFLMNLEGWSADELTAKDPVSMQLNWPGYRTGGRRGGPDQESENAKVRTERLKKELDELLDKTRMYIKAMEDFEAGSRQTPPEKDIMIEPLIPIVKKEIPFTISVGTPSKIKEAIKWVKEQDVKAVFFGNTDVYKMAEEFAESGIPMLYTELLRMPSLNQPYDLYYSIPKVLYDAGVKFAFCEPGVSSVRNLPFIAGMAAAYGLPKEESLKAVTIYPAQFYGIDDMLGSLEEGKMANVVVTDGDLLEPRTHVLNMFINGKEVDLTKSEDYRLYEKFRSRPKIKK